MPPPIVTFEFGDAPFKIGAFMTMPEAAAFRMRSFSAPTTTPPPVDELKVVAPLLICISPFSVNVFPPNANVTAPVLFNKP
ncbi:MAG: hypothetical protein QM811_17110 [Pirellulales bacterium]